MATRIIAIYRVKDSADRIAARAHAIAVEQSVEMPVSAITDRGVLEDIVGKVEDIKDLHDGGFEVRIGLAVATTGLEPGQLMNMLFGNSSIHADIELHDAEFPDPVLSAFGGPNHGLCGLRARVGAKDRPLTCSALKPQGLDGKGLARIAGQLAKGGLDFIKDDHGIADQRYSPFAERVPAIADAVRDARAADGGRTVYLPSLSGNLDQMRVQIGIARKAGLDGVLIAPMITGLASFHTLVRENPDIAFMAHPALAGASHIAPPLLLGKIFRLMGADATVFPNHGGRFGYSRQTCHALADAALAPWGNLKNTVPVPAGGMTPERVPEMLQFYGSDVMLLIGGGLLAAGPRMTEEAAKFQDAVASAMVA
jgi:ribulose-bisphosphate carboxylase large chain